MRIHTNFFRREWSWSLHYGDGSTQRGPIREVEYRVVGDVEQDGTVRILAVEQRTAKGELISLPPTWVEAINHGTDEKAETARAALRVAYEESLEPTRRISLAIALLLKAFRPRPVREATDAGERARQEVKRMEILIRDALSILTTPTRSTEVEGEQQS